MSDSTNLFAFSNLVGLISVAFILEDMSNAIKISQFSTLTFSFLNPHCGLANAKTNKTYATKYYKPDLKLGASAITKSLSYNFPGNVRELQYTIERAVILCDKDELSASEIVFSNIESHIPDDMDDETKLSTVEKNAVIRVLEKHHGNITKAAKELGITRTALYRRLNKYDI
mgnify:CR=1 FL=1